MTTRATISRVQKWTWIFIFVGMAVFGIGLSVARTSETMGHVISAFGALGFLVGAVLVWVRSRMHEDTPR